jgi:hypothetical protein
VVGDDGVHLVVRLGLAGEQVQAERCEQKPDGQNEPLTGAHACGDEGDGRGEQQPAEPAGARRPLPVGAADRPVTGSVDAAFGTVWVHDFTFGCEDGQRDDTGHAHCPGSATGPGVGTGRRH